MLYVHIYTSCNLYYGLESGSGSWCMWHPRFNVGNTYTEISCHETNSLWPRESIQRHIAWSCNGLLCDSTKPLSKPMPTQCCQLELLEKLWWNLNQNHLIYLWPENTLILTMLSAKWQTFCLSLNDMCKLITAFLGPHWIRSWLDA